jgi:hypothetical protein
VATRAECVAALALYREALLAFRNVTGAEIVPATEGADARVATDLVVGIYVSRKIAYDDLDPDDVLPSYLQVIDELKGVYKVPTRVIERRVAG